MKVAKKVLVLICRKSGYADVLLNLAEALNEQGKIDEAVTVVNQVRARAGAQLLNSNVPTTVMGQADMRERIRNERYWELLGEDLIYFDELRWKTWKDKSLPHMTTTANRW